MPCGKSGEREGVGSLFQPMLQRRSQAYSRKGLPTPWGRSNRPRVALGLVRLVLIFALLGFSLSARSQDNRPTVQIVENRRSQWQIVCPSRQAAGVPYAIAELRKYVERISGALLRADHGPQEGSTIVVGLRSDLSPDDQAALPPPAKGYDGYAIAVCAGPRPKIVIAGDNGRGAIFGVYDLLERWGCRWFYPAQDSKDPDVIPRTASLTLPAGSWAVASPMKHRIYNGDAWYFDMSPENAIKQVDHAVKSRCNMIGWQCAVDKPLPQQYDALRQQGVLEEIEKRALALHGPAHSFHLLLPNELFAEHPEWFGMRDGRRVPQRFLGAQFCWSNAEARKVFSDNVARFAQQAPLIQILLLVPFDGGRACECPDCRQAGASNGLMRVMHDVIERLESVRPDLLVETVGGYPPMIEPPTAAKIHPRLRVAWAHWARYMAYGYDDARYTHKQNLEAWHKAVRGQVTVVQYYSDNFSEPWVMPPFAIAIRGDRQYLLSHEIDAVYFLSYPPGYWWNHSLNTYLSGRCFYDAALDPFDLIQDYATHYYGPRAGPLLAKYYDQWARDPDLGYRVRGGTTRRDRETLARQRKELIDPALQSSQDDLVYAHRVGKVAGLHALAERLAEGHRLRHQVQWARQQGEFDRAAKLLEAARVETDRMLASFAELADRNQGLIDKAEVTGFVKLAVKNWIDAEATAIAAKDRQVNEAEVRNDLEEREEELPK
jgi:hypothetical protein